MKDLSIVIVHYNTKDFLKACLASVDRFAPKDLSYEIIIVDNNSTDGVVSEIEQLKVKSPHLMFVQNKENYGFSKANNIGLEHSTGRYVLFLNPDTEVFEKTLEAMVSFMDTTQDAGAATCFLTLSDGVLDDAAHRGFPTPWNAFCHFSGLGRLFPNSMVFNGYHLAYKSLDKIHEIDALAGAFMIVRREVGDEVRWWDEDYFFYGEDLDFCYRLKENGWKIYFVPSVKAFHHKGISAGIKKDSAHLSTADADTRKKAMRARFDAMSLFYKKHYKNRYPKLLTAIVLLGVWIKSSFTVQE